MSLNFVANIKGEKGADGIGIPITFVLSGAELPALDYNHLTETAVYVFQSSLHLENAPSGLYSARIGKVEVFDLGYNGRCLQIVTSIDTAGVGAPRIFSRYRANQTVAWAPWSPSAGGG